MQVYKWCIKKLPHKTLHVHSESYEKHFSVSHSHSQNCLNCVSHNLISKVSVTVRDVFWHQTSVPDLNCSNKSLIINIIAEEEQMCHLFLFYFVAVSIHLIFLYFRVRPPVPTENDDCHNSLLQLCLKL